MNIFCDLSSCSGLLCKCTAFTVILISSHSSDHHNPALRRVRQTEKESETEEQTKMLSLGLIYMAQFGSSNVVCVVLPGLKNQAARSFSFPQHMPTLYYFWISFLQTLPHDLFCMLLRRLYRFGSRCQNVFRGQCQANGLACGTGLSVILYSVFFLVRSSILQWRILQFSID